MVRLPASIQVVITAVGLALTGCPDPEGEFDEYIPKSRRHLDAAFEAEQLPDVGATETVPQASGTYLLAVEASVDTTKPLLFKGDITVDTESDPPTLDLVLIPLVSQAYADANPGSTARAQLPGGAIDPAAVNVTQGDDGSWQFTIDFGSFTIPGEADPILPGQAISGNMVWTGRIFSESVVCGTVDGELMQPAAIPLTNSTFGVVKVEADDELATAAPAGTCAESLQ